MTENLEIIINFQLTCTYQVNKLKTPLCSCTVPATFNVYVIYSILASLNLGDSEMWEKTQ